MSEGSSGWESDAMASAGMRLTVACMESSAQMAALELVTASSMRVLCLLAVFGDTISFSLLLNEGAHRLHHGQDLDQDVSTVPASRPRHETKESGRANLVAGGAAVLGSCQGARPVEGTGTLAMNGDLRWLRLPRKPVLLTA